MHLGLPTRKRAAAWEFLEVEEEVASPHPAVEGSKFNLFMREGSRIFGYQAVIFTLCGTHTKFGKLLESCDLAVEDKYDNITTSVQQP